MRIDRHTGGLVAAGALALTAIWASLPKKIHYQDTDLKTLVAEPVLKHPRAVKINGNFTVTEVDNCRVHYSGGYSSVFTNYHVYQLKDLDNNQLGIKLLASDLHNLHDPKVVQGFYLKMGDLSNSVDLEAARKLILSSDTPFILISGEYDYVSSIVKPKPASDSR